MSNSMICLSATYIVKPGGEETVTALLKEMSELTRQEPGCLLYQAHQALDNPHQFFLYEQYRDEDALNAHWNAPYFKEKILGQVVPLLERREPVKYRPL